jgi:hypothetical protein
MLMKTRLFILIGLAFAALVSATTISMVPIFEPLSLHGTDVDEVITDTGEALQATVMPRPMAMTGAFPETLVDAICSPHQIPTNNSNYKVLEANLLVLCRIGMKAELSGESLRIRIDVSKLGIPTEVDLTSRQVLKLAIVAVRKTLEEYQKAQTGGLTVMIEIEGVDEAKSSLRDLSAKFLLPGGGG